MNVLAKSCIATNPAINTDISHMYFTTKRTAQYLKRPLVLNLYKAAVKIIRITISNTENIYQLWANACLQVKRFLTSLHIKLRIKSFAAENKNKFSTDLTYCITNIIHTF